MKAIKKVPDSWTAKNSDEEPAATRDWLHGFMKRHSDLSLRRPVQTSLGRAAAFNKPTVDAFFDTYVKVRESHEYNAADIWNMDETGLSTVHKTKFVVASKGTRCVGAISSGERGTNVTMALAVSAAGDRIPPFFVYPRVKFQDKFLLQSTTNARGVANGSGRQTSDTFLEWLHHFKNYAIRSSTEKTLLIMDNHESHMTISGLDFYKENNIEVLTLPPHTSHRMQPLDRGVFGPLKTYFDHSCKAWTFNHSGIPITIDLIAELVAEQLLKGASIICYIEIFLPEWRQ
ncbi:uncharacterized protein LOC129766123 [Toxorhynchites rutilus septentrionalis]|uniref:uncharacterized protein LOC129766123 n=1 Tax=Toxorhynchites rutilus septentrionalis TaxID=329112 RepID=UPI00247A4693|nr:uncharacterized protein LOC129766123 [Toxorhynchites rutilus septentrionalis]